MSHNHHGPPESVSCFDCSQLRIQSLTEHLERARRTVHELPVVPHHADHHSTIQSLTEELDTLKERLVSNKLWAETIDKNTELQSTVDTLRAVADLVVRAEQQLRRGRANESVLFDAVTELRAALSTTGVG